MYKELSVFPIPSYPALLHKDTTSWNNDDQDYIQAHSLSMHPGVPREPQGTQGGQGTQKGAEIVSRRRAPRLREEGARRDDEQKGRADLMSRMRPRGYQKAPRGTNRHPKGRPKGTQGHPRGTQGDPRGDPREPKGDPRGTQGDPRAAKGIQNLNLLK